MKVRIACNFDAFEFNSVHMLEHPQIRTCEIPSYENNSVPSIGACPCTMVRPYAGKHKHVPVPWCARMQASTNTSLYHGAPVFKTSTNKYGTVSESWSATLPRPLKLVTRDKVCPCSNKVGHERKCLSLLMPVHLYGHQHSGCKLVWLKVEVMMHHARSRVACREEFISTPHVQVMKRAGSDACGAFLHEAKPDACTKHWGCTCHACHES
jgi:hypothetical protein